MYHTHWFMGHAYEVVNGSKQDKEFRRACIAEAMGFTDMAIDIHLRGLLAPGNGHDHRMGVRRG